MGEHGALGYLLSQKVTVFSRWFFLVLSPLFQEVELLHYILD